MEKLRIIALKNDKGMYMPVKAAVLADNGWMSEEALKMFVPTNKREDVEIEVFTFEENFDLGENVEE